MQYKNLNEFKSFKSGYVSIIGRPNVGKSTLLNKIIGEKIAIVTSKPQTTRNRIIGIKNTENAQIVFIDTPGIHRPTEKLGEFMIKETKKTLKEADIIILMVEPRLPKDEDKIFIKMLNIDSSKKNVPIFLTINKIDTIKKSDLLSIISAYLKFMNFSEIISISALKSEGIELLIKKIIDHLPEGPIYYPDNILTDQIERFMVAEIIREKVMDMTEDEIPYAVAVEIVEWKEKNDIIFINANIYVEKESQKGIIIGKGGLRLKSIGTEARKEIEFLVNKKVYLGVWVKVKEKWRKKTTLLKELGYQ